MHEARADSSQSESDAVEADLVARCRTGEAAAFKELYARHFQGVYRLARRLGTPAGELDDVTQQVFVNAFRNLDRFKGGNFGHWIHRICSNVTTDLHRKHAVRDTFRKLFNLRAEEVDLSPTPEDLLGRGEAEHQVADIVASLRPKQRMVFVLFEMEGLTGEEIAQKLGIPVNTVWTRLHHARQAFVTIGRKRGYLVESGASA